jgi:hypothetical protein
VCPSRQVEGWDNEACERDMAALKEVIRGARALRTQYNLPNKVSRQNPVLDLRRTDGEYLWRVMGSDSSG